MFKFLLLLPDILSHCRFSICILEFLCMVFLRIYAHDDVSAGSWFFGLDVKHVDEGKFCCSPWSTGSICAAV
ncbi:hypothetical protein CRYUN_Cryun12cG0049500 [Craigia yunnanensis]